MTTYQVALAEFTWHELYELRSTLAGIGQGPEGISVECLATQVDAFLDQWEDTRTFQVVPYEVVAVPDSGESDRLLLKESEVQFLFNALEERLREEPYDDGECADNDLLDVLLPLQQKMRICADGLKETDYLLISLL